MAHETQSSSDSNTTSATRSRPCPDNSTDHVILDLSADEARLAAVKDSRTLHVDRTRQPVTGDLVWVELVRHGSTQRMVRRYALDGGWVTLSAPGGGPASIMRRRAELLVLGVVTDAVSFDEATS
jgi:hypothetical protein